MTIVNFTPKKPLYPAVQWDGTPEATEDVDRLLNDTRFELVFDADGNPMIGTTDGSRDPLPVHPGQWIMPVHKGLVVDDAELRQGFEEAQ